MYEDLPEVDKRNVIYLLEQGLQEDFRLKSNRYKSIERCVTVANTILDAPFSFPILDVVNHLLELCKLDTLPTVAGHVSRQPDNKKPFEDVWPASETRQIEEAVAPGCG